MIHYNDPEHMKERQEAKPLTLDEEKGVIETINSLIGLASSWRETDEEGQRESDLIQQLIYNYENLKHFYEVAGGWEGLERLNKAYIEK